MDTIPNEYLVNRQLLNWWHDHPEIAPGGPVRLEGIDPVTNQPMVYYGWPEGQAPSGWETTLTSTIKPALDDTAAEDSGGGGGGDEEKKINLPPIGNPEEMVKWLMEQNPGLTEEQAKAFLANSGASTTTTVPPFQGKMNDVYLQIWGEEPPVGYIEKKANSMNLTQFIDAEKRNPAYKKTKDYQNGVEGYALALAQALGGIPTGIEAPSQAY